MEILALCQPAVGCIAWLNVWNHTSLETYASRQNVKRGVEIRSILTLRPALETIDARIRATPERIIYAMKWRHPTTLELRLEPYIGFQDANAGTGAQKRAANYRFFGAKVAGG
jgi:hypothetical protein